MRIVETDPPFSEIIATLTWREMLHLLIGRPLRIWSTNVIVKFGD